MKVQKKLVAGFKFERGFFTKKTLSTVLVLLLVFLNFMTVSAMNLSETSNVISLFPKESVYVEGNKITLLKEISAVSEGQTNTGEFLDYNDPIVFESGIHIIELDGHRLCTNMANADYGFIVKSGANVTIQNSNNSAAGGICGGVKVEEGGTLTIINHTKSGSLIVVDVGSTKP